MNMEDDNGMLDMVIDNRRAEMDLLDNKRSNIKLFSFEELKNRNVELNLEEVFAKENLKYAKSCKEVLEILNYIPEKFYDKIDSEFIKKMKEIADNEYEFKILPHENISNIELLEETKDILALMMKKFWGKSDENELVKNIKVEDGVREEIVKEIDDTSRQLVRKENIKWYKNIFKLFKIK